MLLGRQLLQARSFSRTVYGHLFQDVRSAGKISSLFMRIFFFKTNFFKVIWGWLIGRENMILSQGSMFVAAMSIPSPVSRKWSNTRYLGANLAL